MARFSYRIESSAALAADTTFMNWVAAAAANFKVRRVILGCRAGAVVPTSQQLTVDIIRATARGTQTLNAAGNALDPRSLVDPTSGVDSTWSVAPTLAATPLMTISFNSQSGVDIPAELLEELVCDQGTANGIALRNRANALPASHLLTATIEIEA